MKLTSNFAWLATSIDRFMIALLVATRMLSVIAVPPTRALLCTWRSRNNSSGHLFSRRAFWKYLTSWLGTVSKSNSDNSEGHCLCGHMYVLMILEDDKRVRQGQMLLFLSYIHRGWGSWCISRKLWTCLTLSAARTQFTFRICEERDSWPMKVRI